MLFIENTKAQLAPQQAVPTLQCTLNSSEIRKATPS